MVPVMLPWLRQMISTARGALDERYRVERVERHEVARGSAGSRKLKADPRRVALLQVPGDGAAHPEEAVLLPRCEDASVRRVRRDVERELADGADGVDRLDAPRGQLLLRRVALTCCNTCYMLQRVHVATTNTLLQHVAP